ncbi:MAG: 3,4-dihydroxy-2-butanone-4-phosphate synthase [Candidatus Dormibacteria bacterium]|nr:bifunctional 3,4-dihydroxy-2-butanone-4-phosphate synthase/GTP cyclohydrolase II [Chloroflexota bacterium]
MPMTTLDEAVAAFAQGKFVIVLDDEERENEGDLCVAAQTIATDQVNFMMTKARGLICVAMEAGRLDELELPPMVEDNSSRFGTGFAVSVDAASGEITTGISARDRAVTIRALADPASQAADFARPGHVFPLRAKSGGVLARAGHTEAVLDLARLAGVAPAGVLCEIASDDGSMARRLELERFSREQRIPVISIADLIAARHQRGALLDRGPQTRIATEHGLWHAVGFSDRVTGDVHVALFLGELPLPEPVLVRVHSECLTGDVFGSMRCDCQAQLQEAMRQIGEVGSGLIVYLRQEGRGIGLMAKLRAYALQDEGLDTVEANLALGLPDDTRDYQIGSQIIAGFGIKRLRLMSNNPRKCDGLQHHGLQMVERVPLVIRPNGHNARYLATKREKLGHLLGSSGGRVGDQL